MNDKYFVRAKNNTVDKKTGHKRKSAGALERERERDGERNRKVRLLKYCIRGNGIITNVF